MNAFERAKLQRYRAATVIGSAFWIMTAALAGYLAITVIQHIPHLC